MTKNTASSWFQKKHTFLMCHQTYWANEKLTKWQIGSWQNDNLIKWELLILIIVIIWTVQLPWNGQASRIGPYSYVLGRSCCVCAGHEVLMVVDVNFNDYW